MHLYNMGAIPGQPTLPIGEKLLIIPTHTDDDDDQLVYFQLAENSEIMEVVRDLISEIVPNSPLLSSVEICDGLICIAKWTVDDKWYRGIVNYVNKEQEFALVYFMDYGNTEVVKFKDGIIKCPEELEVFFPQAFKCLISCREQDLDKLDTVIEGNETLQMDIQESFNNENNSPSYRGHIYFDEVGIDIGIESHDTETSENTTNVLGLAQEPANVVTTGPSFAQEPANVITSVPSRAQEPANVMTSVPSRAQEPANVMTSVPSRAQEPANVCIDLHLMELYNMGEIPGQPTLPIGGKLHIMPTYTDGDNQLIYFQLAENTEIMAAVEDLISEIVPNSPLLSSVEICNGLLCVAKWTEGDKWYRGVVISVNKEQESAVVYFMDYGNTQVVKFKDGIIKCSEELEVFFPQAYYRCLINCREQDLDNLNTVIEGNEILQMDIQESFNNENNSSSYRGHVYFDEVGIDIGIESHDTETENMTSVPSLAQEPANVCIDLHLMQLQNMGQVCSQPTLPIGEKHYIIPTYTDDDNQLIYFQLAENSEIMDVIEVLISEVLPEYPLLSSVQICNGLICVAKWAVDDKWYRGIVIDVDGKEERATIYFMDYGNTEVVKFKDGIVYCPELVAFYPQAFKSVLKDNEAGFQKLTEIMEEDGMIEVTLRDG